MQKGKNRWQTFISYLTITFFMKNLKTEFQIFCKYNFSFYYTKNNKFFLVFSNNSQLKFLQLSNCINITKRNNFFFFRVLNSTLIQPLKFIKYPSKEKRSI